MPPPSSAAAPTGVPTVVVDDPVAALGRLARHVVDRSGRDACSRSPARRARPAPRTYLAHVLAGAGPTVATAGNLNNEIGVPLTVLRADRGHPLPACVEMGARGDRPHRLPLPDRPARRRGRAQRRHRPPRRVRHPRGDRAAPRARSSRRCPPTASPCSTPTTRWSRRWPSRTAARVLTFGAERRRRPGAALELDDLGRPGFDARVRRRVARRSGSPSPAPTRCANAAAAAAMAVAARARRSADGRRAAAHGASRRPAGGWRCTERADGLTVVNDAYNANPDSMARRARGAGRDRRAARPPYGRRARRDARARRRGRTSAHRGVGRLAAESGVDVRRRGRRARARASPTARDGGAGLDRGGGASTAGRDEALAWVRENVAAGDVVLVKASRGAAARTRRRRTCWTPGRTKGIDAVRAILLGGGLALLISLLGTRVAITRPDPAGLRPGDPRRRPDHPPHQARHAHDGRRRHHPGDRARLLRSRSCSPRTCPRRRRCCCCSCSSGCGLVGFLDDFIKIAKQRSLGLRSKAKMIGQTVVAVVFGVLALLAGARGRPRPDPGVAPHLLHPRLRRLVTLPTVARGAADLADHRRHQQRGEPHRRPRRPGHRRLA